MIDFRYHVVSIIAIFLALGLGIVAGTTVLDRVTVDTLKGRVDDLRTRLNEHRKEISELRTEEEHENDLVNALAPQVANGALTGMQVLFIGDEDNAGWHGAIRSAITKAGASDGGSLTLTSKWSLREVEERDQLRRAFGDHTLGEKDPGADAANLLGRLLPDPSEEGLIKRLTDAGFLRTGAGDGRSTFTPSAGPIVMFASKDGTRLADLARGAAEVTPTLVVSGTVEEAGAVGLLRKVQDLPGQLATFDSAGEDRTGIATVLCLRAAADGHGGHFGRGSGLKFLPPPS